MLCIRNANINECRVELAQQEGVAVMRRFNGGGAIFADADQAGISFTSNIAEKNISFNMGVLIEALAQFGVAAQIKGRNDIVLIENGRKVLIFRFYSKYSCSIE